MKQDRLQKLMSQAGVCSRRKAEELIEDGKVFVNGKRAIIGDKATFQDEVIVNGKQIIKASPIYYVMNKPQNTVTTLSDPQGRRVITDLINTNEYIFPVGRLDFNTTGTLILTNDGDLANKLAHPSYEISRVYRVRIERTLTKEELKYLNSDEVYMDGKISKQVVTHAESKTYIVTLKEGRYHHVRNLFDDMDIYVITLTRIEYAGITHIGLQRGQYRDLKPKEITWLKSLVDK